MRQAVKRADVEESIEYISLCALGRNRVDLREGATLT